MTTALVTGISGQDGTYLAELLLAKGYRVIGVSRSNGDGTCALSDSIKKNIKLVKLDLTDQAAMRDALARYQPDEIYNLAAYSSGVGMFDDPVAIGEVNGICVTKLLEAIRETNTGIRLCQASSSEMFGNASESPQSERTPFKPRTPYGAAKLYAHSIIDVYRRNFGIFACSAILFNHESPRRGFHFITRKVTRGAAAIKRGQARELVLETLDAQRDWGFAGDYVEAMHLMLQRPRPDDYVIATGVAHSIRDLCACAFEYLGLDYTKYVRIEPRFRRAPELVQLVGDASKARAELNWKPKVEFEALIRMMVDADMNSLATATC